MKEIGEKIKRLRESREQPMTQQELAWHAKLSVSGLSKIESGRQVPRLDTLMAIAAALGVGLVELLEDVAACSLLAAA